MEANDRESSRRYAAALRRAIIRALIGSAPRPMKIEKSFRRIGGHSRDRYRLAKGGLPEQVGQPWSSLNVCCRTRVVAAHEKGGGSSVGERVTPEVLLLLIRWASLPFQAAMRGGTKLGCESDWQTILLEADFNGGE